MIKLQKILAALLCIILAHFPIGIILGCKYLLGAEGFWQNLVVFGLGFYFLGIVQLICWGILIVVLCGIYDS